MNTGHRLGPPVDGPAPELIDSGFYLENADAPLLHAGLNHADLAHVLDLHQRGVIPEKLRQAPAAACCSRPSRRPPRTFPMTPRSVSPTTAANGSSPSASATMQVGCMPVGHGARPYASLCGCICAANWSTSSRAAAELADTIATTAAAHNRTWLPDQTYLQHAQPSTFGHYLLSFAYPVLRDGRRLVDALAWTNTSPGGAGMRQRQPAARRSRPDRPDARLRGRHRAHPRRDVADRRPGRHAGRRQPASSARRASSVRTSRSGPAASSTT